MEEKFELTEEQMAQITGGSAEEWAELKAWAIRHNHEWDDKDPSSIGDGPVVRWLFLNIPEYDGSASRDNGPATYFVKGLDVKTMNHQEMMAMLTERYGA